MGPTCDGMNRSGVPWDDCNADLMAQNMSLFAGTVLSLIGNWCARLTRRVDGLHRRSAVSYSYMLTTFVMRKNSRRRPRGLLFTRACILGAFSLWVVCLEISYFSDGAAYMLLAHACAACTPVYALQFATSSPCAFIQRTMHHATATTRPAT